MGDKGASHFQFPDQYHRFHKDQVFNFQLNRWYSLGYARFEDMAEAGRNVTSFDSWKTEMIRLGEKAVSEKRFINAAFYFRAAEFYILTDSVEKDVLYDKFRDCFDNAFGNDGIERSAVPYGGKYLPAMRVPAKNEPKKGTIVLHGGFDSFIEEFYSMMVVFSEHGYDVVGFEGPGQGAARRKSGIAFEYEWEKSAKAILDYFNISAVTWLGISMGGYLCFRAAAFEPRIARVIASSVAFDYAKFHNIVAEKVGKFFFTRLRTISNYKMKKMIKRGGMPAWMISNLMYIANAKEPIEATDLMLKLNAANLHSDLVKQDILILTGKDDHFVPFKMHDLQVQALTNAKSVTARVFTKKDQAQNHCQIGNIGLALDVMLNWIDKVSSNKKRMA
ncbi:MAG: alpha/beta hydrolase [Proteobacteria bacterium]|nr:alpha/beta hydrolase [Pseudomonadota bacterium]MBU1387503.1 alpha/beta hydrolase [Pseudomonadota bacterium]MBU1543196.1 alpha/beta hydrolase [Pseudomonadota bacterium]MBU2480275.1 alpha/beta hydrolase [Pseudomonadota bacterium]